ncbi:prephenate dehydratase [Melghirimyces thermohalophilus]|uniref:Prephenate dehydratase n=1 Tax=Melghirimyces thermohalophilus TaxID=1236220 RepID=A0A1G6JLQ1_9BACL|nr:prephenate dehydratase [Melghirimyces thermohalophilus]SDC19607.1 prephenate dehydratase [Melghirimyces thermohalophilus]
MKQPVAYLGPRGTFTYEAARSLFPEESYQHTPCDSIPDVLTAVDSKEFAYGVVPVENAIEGSVNMTLDWLVHHVDVQITGELVYPITQNLMTHREHADWSFDRFTRVISHPQAVAQCRSHLREILPEAKIAYADSTAEAARQVAGHPEEAWVTVGPRSAGELYGLSVLRSGIQDYANNFTRFIAVGEKWSHPIVAPEREKCSLLITLPSDFPGALHRVLASFARNGVNLSRIESRPTKKKLGTYHFFIDAEQGANQPGVAEASQEIKKWGCGVRQLGSYPCYSFDKISGNRSVDKGVTTPYNQR